MKFGEALEEVKKRCINCTQRMEWKRYVRIPATWRYVVYRYDS